MPDRQIASIQTIAGMPTIVVVPPVPIRALVVVNHTLASTGESAERESELDDAAARSGWLMAYPSGRFSSWNSGLCCGGARDAGVDDTTALRALIDQLRSDFALVPSVPTVMGGRSNGAMEAAQFFCRQPGVLAGAFLDAGNLQDDGCSLARVRNLLTMRGELDAVVPIAGITWNRWLGTGLQPDRFLLVAAQHGYLCRTTFAMRRGGVTSTVQHCGPSTIKVIRDQTGHVRRQPGRPGVVDRRQQTVAFINGVIAQAERG